MPSLMNGLSALGAGVSAFAATAGLESQKGELAKQAAILADNLATTRETKLQDSRQAFTSGENTQNRAAVAANAAAQQAADMARTQVTEGGATGRTVLQGQLAAAAAQKQQEFELAKAKLAATLPTTEERETSSYAGGAKPGTPEYQKAFRDRKLISLGIDPETYSTTTPSGGGATPSDTPPAGGSGSPPDSTPAPPVPSPDTSPSATPVATGPTATTAKGATVASLSPYLPPVIAAAVQGDTEAPVAAPKPGSGLSYKPIEPGLDRGAPPGGYNERALLGQPEWLVSMVHAMNEGRADTPGPRALNDVKSLATPEGRAFKLLTQYNPGFDAGLYPARLKMRENVATGKIGDGIQAANTVVQHATEFVNKADDLNNGRIPFFNWVNNTVLSATGSARPGNLTEAVAALAAEARAVYAGSGGGTQSELDSWEKNFPVNGSRAQQSGAMQTLVGLLHGRLTAVANRINAGMQTNLSAMDLLNPTARKSYENLSAPAEATPATSAAPTPLSNMFGGKSGSAATPPPPPPGFRIVQ